MGAKRKKGVARARCRLSREAEFDQGKTTYYLMQPKATDVKLEYMQPGEIVEVLDQGRWSAVTLVSKSESYHSMYTWRYRTVASNDVEYERMFIRIEVL